MVKLARREEFSDIRTVSDLNQVRELLKKGFQVLEAEHGKYTMGIPDQELRQAERKIVEQEEEREILQYEEQLLENAEAKQHVKKDIERGIVGVGLGGIILLAALFGFFEGLSQDISAGAIFFGAVLALWGLNEFFKAKEEK